MKAPSLAQLVYAMPRPAALIAENHSISAANAPFEELFGSLQEVVILDILGHHGEGRTLIEQVKPGWAGMELPIQTLSGQGLYWCETYTLYEKKNLVHILSMHSMDQLRTLEAMYLHAIRKVEDDNLWIVDEGGTLLWARTDSEHLKSYLGRKAHELVLTEDRRIFQACMHTAVENAGSPMECAVRSALDGSNRLLDICFLDGGLFGGRFYAASRTTEPRGNRIVRRLKEAWQVFSDRELAEKLDISRSGVSRANAQERVPAEWIVKTGENTGVSLDWLMSGQGAKHRWM